MRSCHASSDTTEPCQDYYPFVTKQQPVTVPQRTLDGVMTDVVLQDDILIKLDVQGYEDRVIQGGLATLKRSRACIIEVSLDSLYDGQANCTTLFQLMQDLGFRYSGNLDQIQAKDGHVIFFNAVFVRE